MRAGVAIEPAPHLGIVGGKAAPAGAPARLVAGPPASAPANARIEAVIASRRFSQESACDDVARALVPAGVPHGPGTHADASVGTVVTAEPRVETLGTGPQTGSLDTAGTSACATPGWRV